MMKQPDDMTAKKVELLAPAGNPDGFYGAIEAGADAVYLGGDRFGARAYADNFTTEELIDCIRFAHIKGRRVYLTVNTLVRESEAHEIVPYLTPIYEAGLDGAIIQDLGVFRLLRDSFPELELHVSTQMTLTSKYGADFLKDMGACRIVPARELSLDEIKELKAATGLEIECFIHGAMCYCYSGQCLFSSILGGRSGNRGKCAQPCRLPYRMEINGNISRECYPLSLKDMCTIEHLPELIRAGIDSFKIEGRMKKPEYAAGVTAIYRKYIDRFYAGEDCKVSAKDLQELSELYIRSERQDGYYYRHNGADMVTLQNPSYGNTNEKLTGDIRAAYIENRSQISVSIQAEFKINEPAKFIWTVLSSGTASSEKKEMPHHSISVTVTGDVVSPAQKQPVTKDNIHRQLGKLGETVFHAEHIDIRLDENCFYPLKALNEARREAVRQLEDALILSHGLSAGRKTASGKIPDTQQTPDTQRFPDMLQAPDILKASDTRQSSLHVSVRTTEQLRGVLECVGAGNTEGKNTFSVRRLYVDGDLIDDISQNEEWTAMMSSLSSQTDCDIMITLPQIIRKRDDTYLDRLREFVLSQGYIKGFLVRSPDGMGWLKMWLPKASVRFPVYTDAGLYVWNSDSLSAVSSDGFCLPYELKAADQRRLLSSADGREVEKIVYGYIPLMHTANCVFRTTGGCDRFNGNAQDPESANCTAYLRDRYQKRFPVVKNCRHCMNTIYNCLPLSLHKDIDKWQGETDFRVDFSVEDYAQTMHVLRYFMAGCEGERPYAESTCGHEKRGAE